MPSTTSAVTRRLRRGSLGPPPYDEHVRRRDERVESDVAVLGPCPRRTRELVVHFVGLPGLEAEGGHVDVHRRLPYRVRVQVDDDEHAVVTFLLGPGQDLLVVGRVPAEVAQLAQRGMGAADAVEPRQQRGEAALLALRGCPVARTVLVLLAVEVFLAARLHRDVLEQLEAGVDAPAR